MYGRLVRFALPYIRFLFVRPGICPAGFLILPSGFLQIPPHGGHPCLRLTVPTAKSVVDFHHQVIAHAGRTGRSPLFDATLEKRALFMPPPSCATRREAAYIYKTKEPEKPAAAPSLDLAGLVAQLQKSPELVSTLAALLSAVPSEKSF